jgi:probable blue pigment (indigoidine) exporter
VSLGAESVTASGVRRIDGYTLSLIVATVLWGVTTAISKRAVDEVAPLTLLPIQLAISVTALTARELLRGRRPLAQRQPGLGRLAALGILNPGLAYALSLIGLTQVTTSLSVLIWAVQPVMILLFAVVLLRERIEPATGWCTAVAMAGVGLVVFQPDNRATTMGVVLTLCAVVAGSLFTVLSTRALTGVDLGSAILAQQGVALVLALVIGALSWVVDGVPPLGDVSAVGWVSAIAGGLLSYSLASSLYIHGLSGVSADYAAVFVNLIPVFGVAAGVVALHDRLQSRQWLGGVVIVGAVAAVTAVRMRQSRGQLASS